MGPLLSPEAQSAKTQGVITLVLGIVAVVFSCCFGGGGFSFVGLIFLPAALGAVGAIILGAMAMSSAPTDPAGAASKARYAWICLAIWLGLGILTLIGAIVLGGAALFLPALLGGRL